MSRIKNNINSYILHTCCKEIISKLSFEIRSLQIAYLQILISLFQVLLQKSFQEKKY